MSSLSIDYSRQIKLPQVGPEGQARLSRAHVLLIGLGGLGSPTAMYLASSGVGRLSISDFDRVEPDNLQRQIIHRFDGLGMSKALSACATLHALNPSIRVEAIDRQLDDEELRQRMAKADAVVDCSDNFPTRFAINAASVHTGTPLVSGAAVRMEGQVTTFLPRRRDSPCYRCLYHSGQERAEACSEEGILGPVVGVIGALQALETLKVLLGLEPTLCGQLLLFDGRTLEWHKVGFRKNPGCPVCGQRGGQAEAG